uniref:Uncharacterized protein n=1 Tax=Anguilla anguilla TaxID=7936 RepID=A0A0E9RXY0_ANGAN
MAEILLVDKGTVDRFLAAVCSQALLPVRGLPYFFPYSMGSTLSTFPLAASHISLGERVPPCL